MSLNAARGVRLTLAAFLWAGTPSAVLAGAPRVADLRACGRGFDRGDYAGALELCRARLQADPKDVAARILLAQAEAALGRSDAALLGFREALRVDPKSASAHLALGISLLQTGRTQDAVTELQAATALEPRMRQGYYQLGRAYRILGRSAEAEAAAVRFQELLEQERAEGSLEQSDPR